MFVVVRHGLFGNPRDFGDDGFDLRFADDFFCLDLGRIRCAAPASSITSMALSGRKLVDVAGGEFGGGFECALRVADLVEGFEHRFQAAQDLNGFGNGGFDHVDFLEAAA